MNSRLAILDLHVSYVGGETQKNILSILLWAPASVGEKLCLVCPKRSVASEELLISVMSSVNVLELIQLRLKKFRQP